MAVNLSKNGPALLAAYKEVIDAKADTNWALFTYEGNSNDIRLAAKGDGGLEEMVEDLSSGKVMYAFCRVQDPNSGLPKYVLINWTGEGVKDSRKGICANHVSSVANFLKGAHVTINARAEEDVDPETILTKVAKASGASFNFKRQRETQEYRDVPRGPVGSVYQKTNAMEEIQRTDKDSFWAKAQRDEEVRRKEETRRAEQERQKVERERKEMDERQAAEREKRTRERASQIDQNKSYQKQLEAEEQEKEQQRLAQQAHNNTQKTSIQFAASVQKAEGSVYQKTNAMEEIQRTDKDSFWAKAQRDEEVRRKEETRRAEQERQKVERERKEMDERQAAEREKRTRERASQIDQNKSYQKQLEAEEREKEQQQLAQQAHNNTQKTSIQFAASVQKAKEAESLISQRSINPRDVFKQREQTSGLNNGRSPATTRPGKLQSPFLSQKSQERGTPMEPEFPRPSAPLVPETPPLPLVTTSPTGPTPPDTYVSVVGSDSPDAAASPIVPETASSPIQAADVAYPEDDCWSDEFDDDVEEATPEESPSQEEPYESPQSPGTDEDLYEDVYIEPCAVEEHEAESSAQVVCARALYDYQAVDDTEITFDPDDVITGIDKVDEGWWRGYGPDGHYGMFPANYVELL